MTNVVREALQRTKSGTWRRTDALYIGRLVSPHWTRVGTEISRHQKYDIIFDTTSNYWNKSRKILHFCTSDIALNFGMGLILSDSSIFCCQQIADGRFPPTSRLKWCLDYNILCFRQSPEILNLRRLDLIHAHVTVSVAPIISSLTL